MNQPEIYEDDKGRLSLKNCTFDMGAGSEGKHYRDMVWYRVHHMAPYEVTITVRRKRDLPRDDKEVYPVDLTGMTDD